MELWDVYDCERKLTGRTMERSDRIEPGDYHLVAHVCVFNSKGEMLVQHRQPFKHGWPNKWDITAGGSALAGETSGAAAARELFEEVGIRYDFAGLMPNLSVATADMFHDYFLVEIDVSLDDLTLQSDEVQAVKWASKNEILAMIKRGEFIPFYAEFIEYIFKCSSGDGLGFLPHKTMSKQTPRSL